ncbi:hypothetical protein D3C78_403980 [compost metagenome]
MRGVASGVGLEVLGALGVDIVDVRGVLLDLLIGCMQLRAVDRVGGGGIHRTRRDVDQLAFQGVITNRYGVGFCRHRIGAQRHRLGMCCLCQVAESNALACRSSGIPSNGNGLGR